MNALDDLIAEVLHEEAQDAPSTDAFVARVLREQHDADDVPEKSAWVVSVAVAAVTALIVAAAVAASVADRSSSDGAPSHHGPGTSDTTPTTVTEIPPGHAGRLPGWIALSSGRVHVEMKAAASAGSPRDWQVGCPDGVLSALESGDVACAGDDNLPSYEVMVSPETAPAEIEDPRVRWDAPLQPVPTTHSVRIAGTPAVVTETSGDVRYGCPDHCGPWVSRHITVISFPDQARHVSILSPGAFKLMHHDEEGLGWLTDNIYVDQGG